MFRISGERVQPKPGSADLPDGSFRVTYALGEKGEKSLEFARDAIVVKVHHPGEFTAIIPLLQRGEDAAPGFTVSFGQPGSDHH